MTKKIVIKIHKDCDKCRTKAMELAATSGATSVSIQGQYKDELVLVGDKVDAADLTSMLRKKVCRRAQIIKVEEVKAEAEPKLKKAEAEPKLKKSEPKPEQPQVQPIQWHPYAAPPGVLVYDKPYYYDSGRGGWSFMW